MNNKWRWVLTITQAMILLFIPLLVLALIFQDDGKGIIGLKTLWPAWLVMIAWVVVVVFGSSEEG
jgi:membrane protease YdiL (CAAX protease family)